MMISKLATIGIALLAFSGSAAVAQDASAPEAAPSQARERYTPSWSSPDIARVATGLTGFWRTAEPIETMRDEDGSTSDAYIIMSVAPAPVEGISDTLYVETARSDSPWTPYRRAIFQIYPYKDGHRLRTYELAVGEAADGAFDGMYAAPEWFPQLSRDDLIATMDIDISPTSEGFSGSSPYPFPTGVGGAVEMTSSVTLSGDTLTVADRGFDAQGEVVWGASGDDAFVFERAQTPVSVERRDDGMVIIDYGGASGPIVANGDRMHVHYEGFLTDTTRFDSSYTRGQPFIFAYPPGTRAITGWGIGMENFAQGARRKLIIPGYLGYGANGNPRAGIPADAPLLFNIHLVLVEKTEPAPTPKDAPQQPAQEQPAQD